MTSRGLGSNRSVSVAYKYVCFDIINVFQFFLYWLSPPGGGRGNVKRCANPLCAYRGEDIGEGAGCVCKSGLYALQGFDRYEMIRFSILRMSINVYKWNVYLTIFALIK